MENRNLDWYTMENFEQLKDACSAWTEAYNFVLSIENLEEWERRTVSDLVLSEKVFDI